MKIADYDVDNYTVTLQWTAVGEQADVGQGKTINCNHTHSLIIICLLFPPASEYDVRYNSTRENIRLNFTDMPAITTDMILNGVDLKSPQPAGMQEVLQVVLPRGIYIPLKLD